MNSDTSKRESICKFETEGFTEVIEFSPYDSSNALIAYGGNRRVGVGTCDLVDQDNEDFSLYHEHARFFHIGAALRSISWSPLSIVDGLASSAQFCVASDDNKVRLYTSDMRNNDECKILGDHKDFINDVAFEPTEGALVASVGDDQICKVWRTDGSLCTAFHLKSAGMSVKWNSHEPNKLMVAEKRGTIRFYDVSTQQPFMTLDSGGGTLLSADWNECEPTRVGAVVGGEWIIWDIAKSSQPVERDQAHPGIGRMFRWSKASSELFSTLGGPQHEFKIYHLGHHQIPVKEPLKVHGSMSWHSYLPVCAVAEDSEVRLIDTDI